MASNFILNRLKEKFGDDEEDETRGFPDMNYIIGNSSAMDVGEFPTPMDERIGYASQVGGSLMELQITNPATFELEGDQMISVIDQLGIDITTHPDMNAGFASPQKTGQQGYGYETVEQYFTDYLQELAYFKKRVERKGKGDQPLFNIGRMNPHISTTPIPAVQERMAGDVGLDPFGFPTNEYDEESRKVRNYRGQNIFKNPEFLEKLYFLFFLEISNYPFDQYRVFTAYSYKFDDIWTKAQHLASQKMLERESAPEQNIDQRFKDYLYTIQTAAQQDRGVDGEWLGLIEDAEIGDEIKKYTLSPTNQFDPNNPDPDDLVLEETDENLTLDDILPRESINPLRSLNQIYRNLEDSIAGNIADAPQDIQLAFRESPLEIEAIILNKVQESDIDLGNIERQSKVVLIEYLGKLWNGSTYSSEEEYDPSVQFISPEAKWQSLQNHLEVNQIELFEVAYKIAKPGTEEEEGSEHFNRDIDKVAAEMFSGRNPDEYFDHEDREDVSSPEEMHEKLVERILQSEQFQREMWKESVLFYQVIPAWMSSSKDDTNEEFHPGWKAPEFIWETLVKKWEDREDLDIEVEIDLKSPRNGVYEQDEDEDEVDDGDVYHFMDLLENFDEFQRDVAAASGCVYVWAHFTQRKVQFDLKGRDFGLTGEEASEVSTDGWTWVEWMNKFGLGVNLETMQGSPQQRFKIWRPKDIAVACHAINLTARNHIEDLNDELDGRPAKFTIDMEHVASLGMPPLHEMKRFIELEKDLVRRDDLDLDPDKPVSRILRQMHLMDPGVEGQRGTHHGAFERGNKLLYKWLYLFVENGFARNEKEKATILFELAEHKAESSYMMRITMDLIELGVKPEDLDPNRITPGEKPESEEEALIARFFGMERANYNREWAKIEEHAFDPLKGLLEAEPFDYTYSSKAATDNENRPQEWMNEEYK